MVGASQKRSLGRKVDRSGLVLVVEGSSAWSWIGVEGVFQGVEMPDKMPTSLHGEVSSMVLLLPLPEVEALEKSKLEVPHSDDEDEELPTGNFWRLLMVEACCRLVSEGSQEEEEAPWLALRGSMPTELASSLLEELSWLKNPWTSLSEAMQEETGTPFTKGLFSRLSLAMKAASTELYCTSAFSVSWLTTNFNTVPYFAQTSFREISSTCNAHTHVGTEEYKMHTFLSTSHKTSPTSTEKR